MYCDVSVRAWDGHPLMTFKFLPRTGEIKVVAAATIMDCFARVQSSPTRTWLAPIAGVGGRSRGLGTCETGSKGVDVRADT
jgi:hypothetical protein